MRWWSEVTTRLRALFGRRTLERDLEDELAFHLEKETEKNLARGMSPTEARREAYRRFGGVERHREAAREAWGVATLEAALRDARLSFRRMARAPGFTLTATLTLALGIGGTSATFAMVDALLLRPLPYPDDDRLVWVASSAMITPANLEEWRQGMRSVDLSAGFDLRSGVLSGRAGARNAVYMSVSDEYFRLLGAEPVRGRLWNADEAAGGAPPVAVASHRLWTEELGGGDLGGRPVTVGGTTYEVVGVLPDGFQNMGYDADLWVPISRAMGSLNLIARLRPRATLAAARAEVDALTARLGPTPGSDRLGRSANVASVRDQLVGDLRTPALVLFAAAGLVLLLACVNVANLLLSRAAGRTRELAVRSALGAGRGTLVRQLLVECATLVLVGGLAGLLLAHGALRAMVVLAPPRLASELVAGARLGPGVLAFSAGIAAAATLLAGLLPAFAGARTAPAPARATSTRAERRWREVLASGQVAFALVLLVGTALMVRTYLTLRPASPGFEVEDRLVMPLTLPGLRGIRDNLGPSPEDPANAAFVERLLHEIEAASPGARAAAATFAPLSGLVWRVTVDAVDGTPVERPEDGRAPGVDLQSATPTYLDVMGMGVFRGRGLLDTDASGARGVVVINEAAARSVWPDVADPVGRRLTLDPYGAALPRPPGPDGSVPPPPPTLELAVVGVVADTRSSGIHTRARPTAFVSYAQLPWPMLHIVVHQPGGGGLGPAALRGAVAALDPTVPVGDITSLRAVVGRAVAQPRYETTLMSVFGVLALVLAMVGTYGVMASSVAQRTREIGVRMALGATRQAIAGAVMARGARVVGAGVVAGLALAAVSTGVLERSLYGVSPTDPATFTGAAGGLALVSLVALWLPARRAARIEPARTLKEE